MIILKKRTAFSGTSKRVLLGGFGGNRRIDDQINSRKYLQLILY